MSSLLRTRKKVFRSHSVVKSHLQSRLSFAVTLAAAGIGLFGGLPLLLLCIAGGITVASVISRKPTDQLLNQFAAVMGGWRAVFMGLAALVGLSLLIQGDAAYALFEGAKSAAKSGIGQYIGDTEATSLIDTVVFGMWILAAIGGIATIAGGAIQNVMVLVGGIVLFFGMAVLIGLLEFTDNLLFSS